MLDIRDFTVSYQKGVTVIENLAMQLIPGQIHGIVGLNGSGKTTFLNAMYGLISKDSGTLTWQGKPATAVHMAYLETQNFFYSKLIGKEYLRLFQLKNPAFDLEQWNYLFDLPLNKLIESYSTGMKKKLAFMGVLALNRPILVLDEPYNGVDVESYQKIQTVLKKLAAQGKTILITSHIFESLTSICDQINLLQHKKADRVFKKGEFDLLEKEMFEILNEQSAQLIDTLLEQKKG